MAAVEEPVPMESGNKASSYFVVKCATLEGLQKCISTGVWAFRKRANPPQPQDILQNAHSKSNNVILVFSVNNQHGWHGYCESLYPLKLEEDGSYDIDGDADARTDSINPSENSEEGDEEWCRFQVKWITHFQSLNSYECLPSNKTKDMNLIDNSCVNKARNWQEMSEEVGSSMCALIDEHFTSICERRRAVENEILEEIKKESFFKEEENVMGFCEDISTGWQTIIEKIETDLGKVLLACPFGSQRYNCSLPDSDSDILVVYQAKTMDMLGLDRPQQTIKNSHSAKMDYTILELQRYCELLIAGDPRIVETLFIEEESILASASHSWKQLCDLKCFLLTQDCLEKYLREAKGTKGLKQFEKWKKEMKDSSDAPPQKINKLAYIILRLLQSGRDIVKHGCIRVYRAEDSVERNELLNSRLGQFSLSEMQEMFDRYIEEIERERATASFSQPDVAKTKVQQWLVKTRLLDLDIEDFESL